MSISFLIFRIYDVYLMYRVGLICIINFELQRQHEYNIYYIALSFHILHKPKLNKNSNKHRL